MAVYISGERLKLAVDRLRESRSASGVINFFILKRALALNPPDGYIKFSTKDKLLQQAIDELTWWPDTKDDGSDRPFMNVFGTINAKNKGTISRKYRSNGPGDTLRNRAWEMVVETKQTDEALAAKLTSDYRKGLKELTVVKDKKRPMPILADAAVWYHRGQDISALIGNEKDQKAIEKILIKNFCDKINLDADDLKILFAPEAADAN